MKVSIITVAYNTGAYIRTAIDSVLAQSHPDIEYIIIDGASKDSTMDIVRSYGSRIAKVVSEPDKGLYDAMNKGISHATGDIVGILNADDIYAYNEVIEDVVKAFTQNPTDTLYGDLVYVREDNLDKIVRYYPSKDFRTSDFSRGLMPPHPTFFAKRGIYDKFGNFDTQYRICADFDILLRILYVGKATSQHLPKIMIRMRTGGISTRGFFKSTMHINQQMLDSCRKNGVKTNTVKIYAKYFKKVFQLLQRPKA